MTASNTRHRTVPLQGTITKIPGGYPDKLVIYRLAASRYWWVRYYSKGRIARKSTRTSNKRDAFTFAKKFFEDILVRERNLAPITQSPTFERVAWQLISEQKALIERGDRNAKLNVNDQQKLQKDLLPFFGGSNIKDITHARINSYLAKLTERKLAPATLKVHLNLLSKILSVAHRDGLVDRLPPMPKVKTKDSPRGWFNSNEYELLRTTATDLARERLVVRYRVVTDEMRHLITFMVNTFLRPSDIKNLRHRHIEIVREAHSYLRIQPETSKTYNGPIVTMAAAVNIYESLRAFNEAQGYGVGRDDFVFVPDLANRATAMQVMSRLFNAIIAKAGLKKAATGETRTLYSLRHTAIMFRLTLGDRIDVVTLAKNARTSVDMIERFYAKHLQAEMNIDMIQSMRPNRQPAAKKTAAKKSTAKKTAPKKAAAKKSAATKSSTKVSRLRSV